MDNATAFCFTIEDVYIQDNYNYYLDEDKIVKLDIDVSTLKQRVQHIRTAVFSTPFIDVVEIDAYDITDWTWLKENPDAVSEEDKYIEDTDTRLNFIRIRVTRDDVYWLADMKYDGREVEINLHKVFNS